MTDTRTRFLIFAAATALAAVVLSACGGGSEPHVTELLKQGFVDVGVDPEGAEYFGYFEQNLSTACSSLDEGDRWVGNRAAKQFFPDIDHLSAAAAFADGYEGDGWLVRRWIQPATDTFPETRMVDAYRGEDRLLGTFADGSVSFAAHSGPCQPELEPMSELANFELVDAFAG